MKSIKTKLILAFSIIILIPIIGSLYLISTNSKEALDASASEKLLALRESKAAELKELFFTMGRQSQTLAKNPSVIQAMKSFAQTISDYDKMIDTGNNFPAMRSSLQKYYQEQFGAQYKASNNNKNPSTDAIFDQLNPSTIALQYHYISDNSFPLGKKDELHMKDDGTRWSDYHSQFHPFFKYYLKSFSYYDIFLIDHKSGQIVYSVFKELDFATSLKNGPYRNSNFGRLYQKLSSAPAGEVIMMDLEQYYPSYDLPAGFIGSPIFDGKQRVGIIVLQIPTEKIDAITTNHRQWIQSGFGHTGESYLVGSDYKMRSLSRFLVEDKTNYLATMKNLGMAESALSYITAKSTTSTVQKINSPGVNKGLKGIAGKMLYEDYRGIEVLSAFKPLNFFGVNWVLLVEMDEAEASLKAKHLIKQYIFIGFVVLVLGLALAYFIATRLSSPIRLAAKSIENIAQGSLEFEKPKVIPLDESGVMLHAIETTIISLQDIFASNHVNWEDIKEQKKRELVALEEARVQRIEAEKAQEEAKKEQEKASAAQTLAEENQKAAVQAKEAALRAQGEAEQAKEQANQEQEKADKASMEAEKANAEAQKKAKQASEAEQQANIFAKEAKQSADAALAEKKRAEDALASGEASRLEAERLAKEQQEQSQLLQNQADEILKVVDLAAKGDLRPRLYMNSHNVMEQISNGINELLSRLSDTIKDICNDAEDLQSASDRVSYLGANLKSDANNVKNKSESAKQAVNQIKDDIKTAAFSSKEMSATIIDVSKNTQKAFDITRQAVEISSESTNTIEELSKQSLEIGEVVRVINSIASQTNLLALNASIESARAGDAGRGFSVVANEVKELANQTSRATEEIRDKIEEIQQSSEKSVTAIQNISAIIDKVNEITSIIATAVEEQRSTTENIADLLGSVDQSSEIIANDINEVAIISQKTFQASEQTSSASQQLQKLSEDLQTLTTGFNTETQESNSQHDKVA